MQPLATTVQRIQKYFSNGNIKKKKVGTKTTTTKNSLFIVNILLGMTIEFILVLLHLLLEKDNSKQHPRNYQSTV